MVRKGSRVQFPWAAPENSSYTQHMFLVPKVRHLLTWIILSTVSAFLLFHFLRYSSVLMPVQGYAPFLPLLLLFLGAYAFVLLPGSFILGCVSIILPWGWLWGMLLGLLWGSFLSVPRNCQGEECMAYGLLPLYGIPISFLHATLVCFVTTIVKYHSWKYAIASSVAVLCVGGGLVWLLLN